LGADAAPGGLNRRNVNDWPSRSCKAVIYYHKSSDITFRAFFALYPLYQRARFTESE
jgi:hypothetical protein